MNQNLSSELWQETANMMRKCHVSTVQNHELEDNVWEITFDMLISAIVDERKYNPSFCREIKRIDIETGFDYELEDILEEYFDHLEDAKDYERVIASAKKLIDTFDWNMSAPSEYKYRIGNALDKLGRDDEAEAFGKMWLAEYPNDYYAAASNVFLKIKLGKLEEAEKLTERYLGKDLVCNNKNDTFFMAAYRLYEITKNSYAKERVAEKIAEYNAMADKI